MSSWLCVANEGGIYQSKRNWRVMIWYRPVLKSLTSWETIQIKQFVAQCQVISIEQALPLRKHGLLLVPASHFVHAKNWTEVQESHFWGPPKIIGRMKCMHPVIAQNWGWEPCRW